MIIQKKIYHILAAVIVGLGGIWLAFGLGWLVLHDNPPGIDWYEIPTTITCVVIAIVGGIIPAVILANKALTDDDDK
jgi:hypothetical protein